MSINTEYREAIREVDQFVRQLDPSIRGEAFKLVMNLEHENSHTLTSKLSDVTRSESIRSLAPQELIHLCGASTLMDKAIVLAYWLETTQGLESFTSTDLKGAFVSAREPAPANPSDAVAKLESGRKLMRAAKVGKLQSYRLTRTAISQVEAWLEAANDGN